MGVQISQCCSAKKNAVNDETLQRKSKKAQPEKQGTIQNRENSSKSNQSSAKAATNAQINEIPQEQAQSITYKNVGMAEDLLSKRKLLDEQIQHNEVKEDKQSQSSKEKDDHQQNFSDIDEQRDNIDDFNRGLIYTEETNHQNKASAFEKQQQQQKKLMELNQLKIKSNNYRKNFDEFQINVLDQIISGQKEIKEFDKEESNSDSEEEEKPGQTNKNNGQNKEDENGDEGSQEGDQDGQYEEEDDEEEFNPNESYDLFDSNGVLGRITKESHSKKKGMGIDQHSGQTYILKQYSPQDVKELEFDYDLAQKIKTIQIKNACFCTTHAIRKQNDEGLLIVQNHEKGGSLSLFLDTAFNEKEAKLWIIKILNALAILHKEQIVHGNLKPNNILLGQGQLKLTDMNIFKNKKHLHSLYSAPELLQRDQLTEKSDIWSACLIFIEVKIRYIKNKMRTGVMPYLEKDPQMTVEKLKKIIDRMELKLPFDAETSEFIKQMNNLDPNKRRTAEELLNSRYLRSENQNFEKQYLNQLEKKKTLKVLNLTKNFENSIMMSKALNEQHMLKSQVYYDGSTNLHKPSITKGTTLNIDKIYDKGTKQYGITSVLTVVNIKERDLQQQESYMPISVANLMTTQLTNNNGFSQQISNKEDSSAVLAQNSKPDVAQQKGNNNINNSNSNSNNNKNNNKNSNDMRKQFSITQQDNYSLSTNITTTFKQQNTLINNQDESEERQKQFQTQQEKLLKQIKQRDEEQDDEEDEDDDDDEDEYEDDEEKEDNKDKDQKNNTEKKTQKESGHKNNPNSSRLRDKQNKSFDLQSQGEDTNKQKLLEIEQKLLDILNQQIDGEGNSFASDTSQELRNSFVGGVKDRNSLQDLSLAYSHKIPQVNMKFGNKAPMDKSLLQPINKQMKSQEPGFYKAQESIDEGLQQQSIHLSPHNNLKTQPTKTADQMVEEMNRILNEGATVFSHDSLEDIKRQISTQNFVGLRKMLTISSYQKTSNSLKTQKTLCNSQKQGKKKIQNKEDDLKKSARNYDEDDCCYTLDDYVQQKYPKENKSKKNKKSKDSQNKSNSQINNYTQNSEIKSNQGQNEQEIQIQKEEKILEIEQKLLDILNQNDGEGSASFIQGSQDLDRSGGKDNHKNSLNEVPLFISNNLNFVKKPSNQMYQQSNNSLSQQKLKTQGTYLKQTPEQIAEEMNRILNEGISAYSIESYEELKRQISTQNFNSLRRTLTMNQQKTLNSIKTQRTLQGSQLMNKNNNQTKIKIEQPVQEIF